MKHFSTWQMGVYAGLFCVVGAYVLYAGTLAATIKNCGPKPSACGYPDASNSGVQPGVKLMAVPGAIKSPTAATGHGWTQSGGNITVNTGGVLQNIDTAGTITVNGSNVVIKNVRVHSNSPDWFGIALRHTKNVTIQTSTIRGIIDANGKCIDAKRLLASIKDIYGDSSGTRVLGNNLSCMSTGVQIDEGVVQDNFIHDLGIRAGDHLNGTTSNGGGPQLTIQHNTVFNHHNQTDAISLFEDFGSQHNRTINNNLVAGGGYCVYGGQNAGGPKIHDIHITNNRFSRIYYKNCGGYGPVAAFTTAGTGNTFTGNVWDDTNAKMSW